MENGIVETIAETYLENKASSMMNNDTNMM
jgi:hypothetical protein